MNIAFPENEDGCTTLHFWLLPVIFLPKLSTSHHSVDAPKDQPHNSAVAAERNGQVRAKVVDMWRPR